MTQQTPKRVASSVPASRYEFRWEQDSRQRVLKLAGVIDATAASHLESAIINLGSRRLLIDLSDVTSLDPAGASTLLQIAQRLGTGRVSVVVEPEDDAGMTLTDVADVQVLQARV